MEGYTEAKSSAIIDERVRSQEDVERRAKKDNLPDGYYPQTDEEKQMSRTLNRKLDLILLPSLSLLYLFNGLDRGNVGNAETQGFSKDIGATSNDVNNAVSLFFITFVLFQPLSAAAGRVVGAKYWMPFLMTSWGVLTLSNAFIHGRGQLIGIRLLIGVFEAGFYPTVLFYLSTFYPRFDLATRIGIFYGQYAIAGAFSGAISYGVFKLHGSLHNWQYLFIIEGSLTMFVGLIALIILPKTPGSAWFLSQEEKNFAAERMRIDNERYILSEYGTTERASQRLTMRDVVETAKDWKLWSLLVFNICASVPSQAFGIFLPSVVQGMGFSSVQANLMSVPPFICGALGLYLATFSSDHFMERGYHAVGGLVTGLIGLILVTTVTNHAGRYVALCILLAGSYITPSLSVAWLSNNTPAPGKRALVIGVNGFGNLSGVIGSQLFRKKFGPTYLVPLHATLGFIIFSLIGYTAYRFTLQAVNRHRARKIANWSETDFENERTDDTRLGDKKYTFVYAL